MATFHASAEPPKFDTINEATTILTWGGYAAHWIYSSRVPVGPSPGTISNRYGRWCWAPATGCFPRLMALDFEFR